MGISRDSPPEDTERVSKLSQCHEQEKKHCIYYDVCREDPSAEIFEDDRNRKNSTAGNMFVIPNIFIAIQQQQHP